MLRTDELVERLTQRGYRVTGPRRAIAALLTKQEGRFTAVEMEEVVARSNPSIGRATVFRTLELFFRLGLVERVHAEGERRDAYVVAEGVHHHHLVCSRCGLVTEVLGCAVEELVGALAEQAGFRVEGHWLEIVGLCRRCRTSSAA